MHEVSMTHLLFSNNPARVHCRNDGRHAAASARRRWCMDTHDPDRNRMEGDDR